MAILFIEEYDHFPMEGVFGKRLTHQEVAIGAASAASAAVVNALTKVVKLKADQDCQVVFGAVPVADTNSEFMFAGVPELFAVDGGTDKIAVIEKQ